MGTNEQRRGRRKGRAGKIGRVREGEGRKKCKEGERRKENKVLGWE